MKKLLSILCCGLLLAFVIGALSGCQTIQGAGQDIQNAGESLERAVD